MHKFVIKQTLRETKKFRVGQAYPNQITVGNLKFEARLLSGPDAFYIHLYLENNKTDLPDAKIHVLNKADKTKITSKLPDGFKPCTVRRIDVLDPNLQGKGIGSKLYELAIEQSKKIGATHFCSDYRRSQGERGSDVIWKKWESEHKAIFYPSLNRYCMSL